MSDDVCCSFCGHTQSEVRRLVAGQEKGVFICNDCVGLCNELVKEQEESGGEHEQEPPLNEGPRIGESDSVVYFDEGGEINTQRTIEAAVQRSKDLDIKHVVVATSTGETAVRVAEGFKDQDVKIIAITGVTDGPLAKESDATISVEVSGEACPFNMAPTTSTTAMLAIGDALAMALLEARGLTRKDYAKLHPGGAIGRTLLLRVSDIMRTDERLPIVTKGQRIKEAVLAMTGARSGSAAVTDKDNVLLGIVTDGDLRRRLASDDNIMSGVVDDIMTPSPVTVGPDQLAAEVLRIFEEKDIDDILVVDDKNHVIGAVDIQDLPKLKIM